MTQLLPWIAMMYSMLSIFLAIRFYDNKKYITSFIFVLNFIVYSLIFYKGLSEVLK